MNFLNEMKLGTRISFMTVVITALIFTVLISYVLFTFNQIELKNSYKYSEILANENASLVETQLDEALVSARTISQTFKGYKDISKNERRDYYNSILKNILASNPSYTSVWTCWEENAFDNSDSKYANKQGYNSEGRYAPYISRDNGKIAMSALEGYVNGPRSYYQDVKKNATELIINPYKDEKSNNGLMTTVVVPIIDNNGIFLGVTGIDISLIKLANLPFSIGDYKNSFYFLMDNNGQYIVHDEQNINKNFSEIQQKHEEAKNLFEEIAAGNTLGYKAQNPVNFTSSWHTYAPVKLGDSNNLWVFGLVTPMNEFTAKAGGATLVLCLILILTLVAIAGAIIIVVSKMVTKPISNLVVHANQLALGDTSLSIKSDSKDEIGELIRAFESLVSNIKEQTKNAEQIARGNLQLHITPKSDKDVLSKSMQYVVYTLNKLVAEADALTKAAIKGDLRVRGNEKAFKGGYKEIVSGFNKTLDKMVTPINEAAIVLSQMEQGNLGARMIGEYGGDFEKIKTAVNTTGHEIQGYIAEMADVLTQLSNKNLDVEINRDYLGDFNQMKTAINYISDSFNLMASELQRAAEQVESGASDVASTSQVLSEGSAEQASTVEEISATITEVASQTKENASNATNANDISVEARKLVELGNKKMQDMLQAMESIDEASNNISKIIRVIDSIAFQTKILSLNAAVEAARAGEFGKGFAVVAEEVRSLATRSADAAQETTNLIDDTIQKVEEGKSIANNTANSLSDIVIKITEASEIVEEIAEASLEQSAAIDEIGAGIIEVSKVTQANSATAEQSATASQNMSKQAQLLNDLVSEFNLKDKSIDKDKLFAEIEAAKSMAEAAPVQETKKQDFESIRQALLTEIIPSYEDNDDEEHTDENYEIKDPAIADIVERLNLELMKDNVEEVETVTTEVELDESAKLDDSFDFSFLEEEKPAENDKKAEIYDELDVTIDKSEVQSLLQGVLGNGYMSNKKKETKKKVKKEKSESLGDKLKGGLKLFGKKKDK